MPHGQCPLVPLAAAESEPKVHRHKHIMVDEKMKSNKEMAKKYESYEDAEDDFM